jgi:Putative zinc-finger
MTQRISCAQCRDMLPVYIAGRLSQDEHLLIEQHLIDCPQCQRYGEYTRTLNEAFQEADSLLPAKSRATPIWNGISSKLATPAKDATPEKEQTKGVLVSMSFDELPSTPPSNEEIVPEPISRWRQVGRYPLIAIAVIVILIVGSLWYVGAQRNKASNLTSGNSSPSTSTKGPIIITTDHSTYAPADAINATIKNTLTSAIEVPDNGDCPPLSIQREDNGQWNSPQEASCITTAIFRPAKPLASQQTLSVTVRPIQITPGHGFVFLPGKYRLELQYTQNNNDVSSATVVYSQTFNVQGTLPNVTDGPTNTPDPGQQNPIPSGTPGSITLNGCLTQQAPPNMPSTDVVATEQGVAGEPTSTDFTHQVNLTNGQVLQVRLKANVNWHMTITDPDGVLTLQTIPGAYSKEHASCIWRFTTNKPGTAQLTFTGGMVCPPNSMCPDIAMLTRFAVTVK